MIQPTTNRIEKNAFQLAIESENSSQLT